MTTVFGSVKVSMAWRPPTRLVPELLPVARTLATAARAGPAFEASPTTRGCSWLAQQPTAELLVRAERAAEIMALRLEVREVGTDGLERQLEQLVGSLER